ncbi:MAG: hypothetical protein J6V75_00490 [Bacteroidaceae bacterium]|nr:hypothetical protein [Bacteroidaceae bacterium]
MAKLSDILSTEQQRSDSASRRVIHLYQEGSFLRAYEWSAWLCCRYLNSFKVTRRIIKGTDDTLTFVGFPVTSIGKYSADGRDIRLLESNDYEIILLESVVQDDELSDTDFNNWKQSVPIAESKKKETRNNLYDHDGSVSSSVSLTGIMQQILAFPIERKSPLDCMVFMAEIKQQIAAII